MNLKKFAIRGIVFLAIFVALCMFFSGTVRTITTPKVRLATPKKGKLEERIKLTCKPAFPTVEPVSFPLSDGLTLSIVNVNSRAGYTVKAGEVIVEAKVADYDAKYKQYQQDYDTAAAQLLTIENKNRKTRITQRDQAYADAYYGLLQAVVGKAQRRGQGDGHGLAAASGEAGARGYRLSGGRQRHTEKAD